MRRIAFELRDEAIFPVEIGLHRFPRIVGAFIGAPVAVISGERRKGIRGAGDEIAIEAAVQLGQLFANLIENAIVHTPPGTSIHTRLSIEDGRIVAEVCDSGPGIPESERTKVFRRFYRLDASRHSEGAGLGLALVAAIAALHGADYSVVDCAPGFGVRIRFPDAIKPK